MLEWFHKARIRGPVVVYEEINAVFLQRKTQKLQKS